MGCSLRGVERSVQACHINHKRHRAYKEEQSFFTFSCVGHTALTRSYLPPQKKRVANLEDVPLGARQPSSFDLSLVEYSSWNQ